MAENEALKSADVSEQSFAPEESEVLSKPLRRSRLRFHLCVGACVIVLSFLYGLSSGFNDRVKRAQAGITNLRSYQAAVDWELPSRVSLPAGVKAIPIGQDVRINSRNVDAVSFVSVRSVESLLREQVAKWESDGLLAVGAGRAKRGVAMAFNPETGERYSVVAWRVPKRLQRFLSQGYPVQGMSSVSDQSTASDSKIDEMTGKVPGVELPDGASPGAVFSSKDPGGRSYTGTYTNPGALRENMDFYRNNLGAKSWKEEASASMGGKIEQLAFVKGKEVIELFFSPMPGQTDSDDKTVVTIIRRPRLNLR